MELQTDPAPVSFETWIATFPGLKPEDRRAEADPDGDQLPNRIEFLLNGRSPVVAEPLPGWYPSGSNRLEHVLRWRDGIPHRGASVWWTDDLVHTAWQPIQAGVPFGFEVIANQNFQTLVTGPKDQSRFFLQVRYDPSAD